jgi:hypothetical protein
MPYLPALLVLLAAALPAPLRAQTAPPTNRAVLERLAADCLPPDLTGDVVLVADGVPPFLVQSVERRLVEGGVGVWTLESDAPAAAARLSLARWTGSIGLTNRDRRRFDRTITSQADVRLVLPDGRVAHARTCRGDARDAIARSLATALEDPLVPETVAVRPAPSRLRRWAEPTLAAAGVAVGVLLLFSVRS